MYFLYGEETYFIDEIVNTLEAEVLTEEQKGFDLSIFYGKDTDPDQLVGTAKQFPVTGDRKLVILKEGQQLRSIDKIQGYVDNPSESTVFVVTYKGKKPDGRKSIFKTLKKNAVSLEAKKIYDNQMPDWVTRYCASKQIPIHPKAVVLLLENLGNNLQKIVNELEKLEILLGTGVEITEEHIEKHVGISKEYNLFELSNAVGAKNVNRATRIALHLANNEKNYPMQVVVTTLYNYFNKILRFHYLQDKSKGSVAQALGINPFFVQEYQIAARNYPIKKCVDIISELRNYDNQSKGIGNVSTKGGALLKELVYKILH